VSISSSSTHLFLYYYLCSLPYLYSFPTRRSSDLVDFQIPLCANNEMEYLFPTKILTKKQLPNSISIIPLLKSNLGVDFWLESLRSEEHTSELQSRENLVCRLLLEKKKKTIKNIVL